MDRPLRTGRPYLLGACIIAIVLAVIFGDLPGPWLFVGELQNGAHAPAFGSVAVLLLLLSHRWPASCSWSPVKRYIAVLLVATAIGAAIEVIQGALHRDMSLEDVFHDFLGASIGLGIMHACKWEPASSALRRTSIALAWMAVVIAVSPIAWSAAAYVHRDRLFPVILQFTSPLDRYFLFDCAKRGDLSRLMNSRLVTTLEPNCHRQIGIGEPYSDWSGYRQLNVDIANEAVVALSFTIRIEDVQHNQEYADRFNRAFSLAPMQRKVLVIPLEDLRLAPATRQMDMKQIYWMEIFANEGTPPGTRISMGRIWLN